MADDPTCAWTTQAGTPCTRRASNAVVRITPPSTRDDRRVCNQHYPSAEREGYLDNDVFLNTILKEG